MPKRKIIIIDEAKCNGCGACIPNCPEGALQMIDGKARLVSDISCDGLGACIGHCAQGAISIEERQAVPYDETTVMERIIGQGPNVIRAHLRHLREHNQQTYLSEALAVLQARGIPVPATGEGEAACSPQGCPGARIMDFRSGEKVGPREVAQGSSELRQWPVQLMLVPVTAPYLNNADILIAADCVPFAYSGFHGVLLKGKTLLVACPKLDEIEVYRTKLAQILQANTVKSIVYAHMEVPCCFGLIELIRDAIKASGKDIPFREFTISIKGELQNG